MEEDNKVEVTDQVLKDHGFMFMQLLQSQRFRELMNLYFTFQKFVNEETKEIDFRIIENPPEVVAQRMAGMSVSGEEASQLITGVKAMAVLEQTKKKARRK